MEKATHLEGYTITDDKLKFDYEFIHTSLVTTYWANKRSFNTHKTAFENSFSKMVFSGSKAIACARLVTDYVTYGYLADVFVAEEYRGRGIAKWLVESILNDPKVAEVAKITLRTKDAQTLYTKLGFTIIDEPGMHLQKL